MTRLGFERWGVRKSAVCLGVLTAFGGSHFEAAQAGQVSRGSAAGRFRNPPVGWTLVESIPVSDRDRAAFSRNLGGPIVEASNTVLSVGGQRLRVNALVCQSDAGAVNVQAALIQIHRGAHTRCPRDGNTAFELISDDMRPVERAYRDLGLPPPVVTYDVSFHATPIDSCDPMSWNRMFNAFLVPNPNEAGVRELAAKFTFGGSIPVRSFGLGASRSTFSFVPAPAGRESTAGGDITAFSFRDLPQMHGVPRVALTAVVTAEAFAITPTTRQPGPELLGPTDFWPSTDPKIVALAKQIVGDRTRPDEKVAALLEWFVPARNIRYDGPHPGSRYGVKAVIEQGFGRCWDFSDCFVTLARASGIPCRQVLGWIHGEGGHVWAEVFVEGRGWRQVDPTAGTGCDTRYVPFFAVEAGAPAVVYTSAVHITPRRLVAPAP
jgi:hypothetical protein